MISRRQCDRNTSLKECNNEDEIQPLDYKQLHYCINNKKVSDTKIPYTDIDGASRRNQRWRMGLRHSVYINNRDFIVSKNVRPN